MQFHLKNQEMERKLFNSLKYAKILESAGLPRNQAETHIQILSDVLGEDMATKEDIKALRKDMEISVSSLRRDMDTNVAALKEDIKSLRTEMHQGFQNLELRMTLKLGALMAGFLATGLTAAKLLFI